MPTARRLNFIKSFSAILLMTAAVGCSSSEPRGTVKGKVTLDGSPLSSGVVTFMSSEGYAATGDIGPDGGFSLAGELPPGSYVVSVAPPALTQAPGTDGAPAEAQIERTPIPNVYWNETTSGLVKEVADGENDVAIELTARANGAMRG